MSLRTPCLFLALAACGAEPLDLPEDPAERGVPVGARTLEIGELTVEVWYPASDDAQDGPRETYTLADWVPDVVADRLGSLPDISLDPGIVRDAPLRKSPEPYPVVIFSHGFAGFRAQSVDLTVHLASRGYVVLAADHSGRTVGDLLPCLFEPVLEGCTFASTDPAVAHVLELAAWVRSDAETSFLGGAIDPERLALSGHSAGGSTTGTVGETDERFTALLPMAAGQPITRDVPTLRMAGTCDEVTPYEPIVDAHTQGHFLAVSGGGHHAFSDICDLDFLGLAEEYLLPRDDLNPTFADSLVTLGADGCPGIAPSAPRPECDGAWLDLEVSAPIVRHYATRFLDLHLLETGPGLEPDLFPEAVLDP